MKPLSLSLAIFAIGCYAQQPVQYVPQQAAPVAPPPTIIEVPKDQPQPQRPIIIMPRGEHRYDYRHGTTPPAPPAKPAADNSTATFTRFVSDQVQLPHEELVQLPAPPHDVAVSQSTTVDASQPSASSVSPPQPVKTKILALRARIRERLAERLHRSKR